MKGGNVGGGVGEEDGMGMEWLEEDIGDGGGEEVRVGVGEGGFDLE